MIFANVSNGHVNFALWKSPIRSAGSKITLVRLLHMRSLDTNHCSLVCWTWEPGRRRVRVVRLGILITMPLFNGRLCQRAANRLVFWALSKRPTISICSNALTLQGSASCSPEMSRHDL